MSAADWNVEIDPIFKCWLWCGSVDAEGYAVGSGVRWMHRHIYEREVGPIPDGMVIEHGCKVRRCCSPGHLRAVTQSENLKLRSWRNAAKRATCDKGHDLRVHAMVTGAGGRVCRVCSKEWAGG